VDEPIVELETDKVTLEVNAPASGILAEIIAKDGETVGVGALLGQIGDGAAVAPLKAETKSEAKAETKPVAPPPSPAPAAAPVSPREMPASPAAAKIAADHGFDPAVVEGSGKRGQVLKGDVLATIANSRPQLRPPPPLRYPSGPRRRSSPRIARSAFP